MPQCTLVLVAGRREEQDRGVAAAIQREPSSHCPGVADSPGICPSGGPTGRRMKTGSSAFGRTKNRGTVRPTERRVPQGALERACTQREGHSSREGGVIVRCDLLQ